MPDMKRPSILFIAYACNPYKGSEHGVGWGWLTAIADWCDVHVITAEFERADLKRYLDSNGGGVSNVTFHSPQPSPLHYDTRKPVWRWIESSPFKLVMNFSYRIWQKQAFRLAKKLSKEIEFDICHVATYVGFRFPGEFHKLSMPLVWGPLGGLENTPVHILRELDAYSCAYHFARNLLNTTDKLILRGPRMAFAKAARTQSIIAATSGVQAEIAKTYGVSSNVISEIGVDAEFFNPYVEKKAGTSTSQEFRICWSGTHTSGKALPLLFRALDLIQNQLPAWKLDILGAGPESSSWRSMGSEKSYNSCLNWHGEMSREKAIGHMADCDLFIITSLKDLTSTVLIEALALGKPVLAPAHCGFTDVLSENCGALLEIKTIEGFISSLANEILRLSNNKDELRRLSTGALQRSQSYHWSSKQSQIASVYRGCL